ncbi:MAG TPA: adenosine deaminase [Actinomycetes bacterium]|nr:adenosine deaminase [Actinomycetes bacterium]
MGARRAGQDWSEPGAVPVPADGARRNLSDLPKAHLHLHFTGSMRHGTLLELADQHGVRLPDALKSAAPPELRATDERGWFRFQRLYDAARSVLRTPADLVRLLREAAEDERAEGSGWLEIQVDPSSYAPRLGGLTPTVELILGAAADAASAAGIGIGVILAANRTKHPLDARTLARLAGHYAGRGVVGFGLSNDERRSRAADFERAFTIAARSGLAAVPHGGELAGPASVADCLDLLHATRIGHGVRAVEDPPLLARLASAGIVLEVCPTSNLALGVFDKAEDVPVPRLREAGIPIALGADDPLLFGSRLVDQYALVRSAFGASDVELAELARSSVRGSLAPDSVKARLLTGIDRWLTRPHGPAPTPG